MFVSKKGLKTILSPARRQFALSAVSRNDKKPWEGNFERKVPEGQLSSTDLKPINQQEFKKLQKMEGLQGLFQGAGFLLVIFAGFFVYNDYDRLKHKVLRFVKSEEYSDIDGAEAKSKKNPTEYVSFSKIDDSRKVPGLYLWGSNVDGIVNPENLSTQNYTLPTRLHWFDGIVIKDMKINTKIEDVKDALNIYLDKDDKSKKKNKSLSFDSQFSSAFAIDSNGDLIQWGKGFNPEDPTPRYTIKNQNLVKGQFSNKMLYLMNKNGEIFYVPVNLNEQMRLLKQDKKSSSNAGFKSWLSWSSDMLPKLDTSALNKEKIVDFDTGISHLVALTDKHKTYVTSTGLANVYKAPINFGQYGLTEYSQFEDAPPPNKLLPIELLNNDLKSVTNDRLPQKLQKTEYQLIPRKITQIAAGNYHTLATDSIGNVYSFGKNTFGQLGFQVSYNTENVPIPRKIEYFYSYFNKMNSTYPLAKNIYAGSHSSFVSLVGKNVQEVFRKSLDDSTSSKSDSENDEKFHFGFGKGLYGQLGLGYYIHANSIPKKLKVVHDLNEFNEDTNSMDKIKVSELSIGKNHTFITLSNNDVLGFGGNKFGQLGTGKRVNVSVPQNIAKIVEADVCDDKNVLNLTKFINNTNNRLQLLKGEVYKFKENPKGKNVSRKLDQVIVAGNDNSAIYYTTCDK